MNWDPKGKLNPAKPAQASGSPAPAQEKQEKQAPSAMEQHAHLAHDSEKPTGISWELEKLHMRLSPCGS